MIGRDEAKEMWGRRQFLRAGLLAGAAGIAERAVTAAGSEPGRAEEDSAQAAASTSAGSDGAASAATGEMPPVRPDLPPFELEEATIVELQEGLHSKKYTARMLTEIYLARIEALDRAIPIAANADHSGGSLPGLRAVIETNPDALAIAEALDEERRTQGPRGPLHGIPVLLKDNIDTGDRMTTTAGSLALAGSTAARDSFVARKLRAAGAVLLGKANLSEWANIRSNRSSSGWSARGGQCRNPYALDRSPCGSSSGSAAAVSAGLTAVAVGTETDGSIVCPSSTCGIVGIKPTVGMVSRSGIIPISHTQDTAGPMARTVADAALLLSALAGEDPQDEATRFGRGLVEGDYTRFLDPGGLKGTRIGVARNFFGFSEGVDRIMEESIAEMKRQGVEIIDPANIESIDQVGNAEIEVLLYEFKAGLNAYLAGLGPGARIHTLAELIAFNEEHRDTEMPYFGQELFVQAEAKGTLKDKTYRKALATCRKLSRTKGIDAILEEHKLDAILAPTGGPAWVIDLVNGDHFSGGSSTAAAVAGYPSITVPAGYIFGLPVGISFFGRAWSESKLLRIAYAYEQATRRRKPPRFLAGADLQG